MSIYNVHAGHCPQGKGAYGAVGILLESVEDRKVKDRVIAGLRAHGDTVYDCTCEEEATQNGCLGIIVNKCNQHKVDYDLSIHLNSGRNDYNGDGVTGGVEVWCYDEGTKAMAEKICAEISKSLGINNRGVKYSKGLYVLSATKSPAMIIECCFVDDKDDANRWNADKCGDAIVKAITGSEPAAVPTPAPAVRKDLGKVDIFYNAKTTKWWGDVKNDSDWAGAGDDKAITAIAIRVNKGAVEYQVHTRNGKWLPKVTKYDLNDHNNGYAGDGKTPIDGLRVVYLTPDGYRYQCAYYKVSPQGMTTYYPTQCDDQTTNGQDGYAGCFGKFIDKVQMVVK